MRRNWSKVEAKRAKEEHDAAERELRAISKHYLDAASGSEEKQALLSSDNALSPAMQQLAVSVIICSPLGLAMLAFAAGYTPAAVVVGSGSLFAALALGMATPLVDPTLPSPPGSPSAMRPPGSPSAMSTHTSSPSGSPTGRRPPSPSQQRASAPAKRSIFEQDDSVLDVMEQQQESVARFVMLLMGAAGTAQLIMLVALLPPESERSAVDVGLRAVCAAGLLLMVLAWGLCQLPRVSCLGSVANVLDASASRLRTGKQVLFHATEEQLRSNIESCNRHTTWRRDELPSAAHVAAEPDGSFRVRSLDLEAANEQPANTCVQLCQRLQRRFQYLDARVRAFLDSTGEIIRHSPIKAAFVAANLGIATDGLAMTPVSIAALVAALVIVAAMSDYVRIISNEVDYADGVRWEAERRRVSLTRRTAEGSLRRALQLPLEDVEPNSLALDIETAIDHRVSEPLIEQAREIRERAASVREKRAAEKQKQRAAEKQRRESAEEKLAEAIKIPRTDANLGDLMLALDAARAASVKHELVAGAEKVLKDVLNKQGKRARAEARLQAFLKKDPSSPEAVRRSVSMSGISPQTVRRSASMPAIDPSLAITMSLDDDDSPEGSPSGTRANPLANIDMKDLDAAVEEGKAEGVSQELLNQMSALKKQVVQAQFGVQGQSTLFSVKLKHKAAVQKWKSSGGQERLGKAMTSGEEALALLQKETEAGPLSAAVEGLALALSEAMSVEVAEVKMPEVKKAEELLRELRECVVRLDTAHQQLETAMDSAEDVSTYQLINSAAGELMIAIPMAIAAHVDKDLVAGAEAQLRELRDQLRAAAAAEERLTSAIAFLVEHLALFNAKKKTQLKVVAVPALTSAISLARSAMVPPAKIKEGEDKLAEANLARARVEEATQWLSTASKAAVKALTRAAEDPDDSVSILNVAVDALASAIAGAVEGGAELADIASAEQLLTSIRQSARRASTRGGTMLPTVTPAMLAKYGHITGGGAP